MAMDIPILITHSLKNDVSFVFLWNDWTLLALRQTNRYRHLPDGSSGFLGCLDPEVTRATGILAYPSVR